MAQICPTKRGSPNIETPLIEVLLYYYCSINYSYLKLAALILKLCSYYFNPGGSRNPRKPEIILDGVVYPNSRPLAYANFHDELTKENEADNVCDEYPQRDAELIQRHQHSSPVRGSDLTHVDALSSSR